ncbi:MAG: hypothetical protein ACTHN7_07480 [Solirubrobacterales bacterium]
MPSPFGKISWRGLVLLVAIAAAIVVGMLLPGRTGVIVQVAGWVAFAILVILEVGIRSLPPDDFDGDDRRPY